MIYAILYHPGHNRVYFETSVQLSVSEFCIAAQQLSTACSTVQQQRICGIDYLTFETVEELDPADLEVISGLSFVYALFRVEHFNGELYLKPLVRDCARFVDESMSTILKYTGKTNEIFTRMMINIAYHTQGRREDIRLLDPIAGKGTTLYEALMKGFDVYGIEIGDMVVNESYHFVKRFLETAHYKYEHTALRLSGPNKSFTAARHTFVTAKTKEAFKNKETRTIELIAGNAKYADQYYRKSYFDLIVGDLPYGVQHGNVTKEKQTSLTRNPTELLRTCLPAWMGVLKSGGALALAWNANVLPRNKMERLLEEHGLTVKKEEAYLRLAHRVDQSILRDVVVAQKL